MKKLTMILTLCLAGAAAAIATNMAVAGSASTDAQSAVRATTPPATALQDAFIAVYKRVSPSVVQIQTPSGLGSGIVFDSKGHIVTNDHVVAAARSLVVTTASGRRLPATLVGEFPADDLAVIKVAAPSALRAATFTDSTALRVGQIAIAIGNPLGLSSSVTDGIVSALNRQVPEGNGVTLRNAIQTSAPINPGNSGGALVDIQGRVIGIPTLAAASSQSGTAVAGIGFAVPSSVVKDIAGQLIRNGRVVNTHRAYLGVQISDTGRGVYVAAVTPGGPAARAAIAIGDVIVAVAGKPTLDSNELGAVLAGLKPNQSVKVQLTRQDGSRATVAVTLGELPGT